MDSIGAGGAADQYRGFGEQKTGCGCAPYALMNSVVIGLIRKASWSVDASIWVNQFLKAMRNQQGEVIHNAHLLGFFRRICK